MFHRLRARKEWQFFAVLPRADRPLAIAWWLVLALRGVLPAFFAVSMGVLVGAVQHGESLAWPLAFTGHRVRPAAGPRANPAGRRRQPGRSDRGMALRPPDGGVRAAAGRRPSGRSGAHQRPDGGPRLRPRHDRPAAVDLDGLHRRRAGGDHRRPRLRDRARGLRLVGAPRAGRSVARHALAAARERRVARPQHRGGPWRAARRRLRLPPRGRSGAGEGAAALRPGRLDARTLRRTPDPPAGAPVRRRPVCASAR